MIRVDENATKVKKTEAKQNNVAVQVLREILYIVCLISQLKHFKMTDYEYIYRVFWFSKNNP